MPSWNYRGDGRWRLPGIGFKRHIASLGNTWQAPAQPRDHLLPDQVGRFNAQSAQNID